MAGLIWILLSACLLGCTSQISLLDQKYITAESGQDVILTCRAPKYNGQTLLWNRADLGDEYVLLHRNGRIDLGNPHPSFVNRVALQDRQMKDGDVSLILKNVTINDTGIYECGVFINGTNDPICNITLTVDPPGSVGLKVGLIVSAVLLVAAVVGFLIYRKHKKAEKVLLFLSKYLRPLNIKQSPAAVPIPSVVSEQTQQETS